MRAALAALVAFAPLGCGEEPGEAVLLAVAVTPEGTVAACAPVTLYLTLTDLARFSVDADG